jgi:hypothetical protein
MNRHRTIRMNFGGETDKEIQCHEDEIWENSARGLKNKSTSTVKEITDENV